MPSSLSYPGVYVEEVASDVRTIVGVATSVAAFFGRALTGPVNTTVSERTEVWRRSGRQKSRSVISSFLTMS